MTGPLSSLGLDFAWLRGGRGIAGWGRAAVVDVGTGRDRFERADEKLRRSFEESGLGLAFASFTFDSDDPESSLVVPETVVEVHIDDDEETDPSPKIRYEGSTVPEIEWLDIVAEAVARIRDHRLDKVVLARDLRVWAKADLDTRNLAARLARRYPECFTFVHGPLVGATPELLVRRRGTKVESLVLAGTAKRGADAGEDAEIGDAMLASAKDADEHRLAVASVADVLQDCCSALEVDSSPQLLKLANVQHLATWLRGDLATPLSALQLAGRLHPTAATCGTPRSTALQVIRELERMPRGCYAGPVGWVDSSGDGELGIAIRCAEVHGSRARLFAGNGIVAGSLPEAELEETRLKLRAMQSALGD